MSHQTASETPTAPVRAPAATWKVLKLVRDIGVVYQRHIEDAWWVLATEAGPSRLLPACAARHRAEGGGKDRLLTCGG